MPTDNLVQWLSEGPLWLFAIAIGLIVSIDVAVVEFTRDYESEKQDAESRTRLSRQTVMGLWHSTFHAASFFLYVMVIYALQSFAFLQIDLWDLNEGVGTGFLTIVNFLIICFIWWTYRSKIKEDHSEKSDDSAEMDRRDMKMLIDAVRRIAQALKFNEQSRGVAIAGSVAVDMLAISALLKIYLLPNGDRPAITQLTGYVTLDTLVFATIIFVVVFLVVFFAQAGGARTRSTWIVALMRLAEPLAVFYIVAGTVRALMQLALGNYGDSINRFGLIIDLGFAVAIVVSLIVSSGLTWSELLKVYTRRSSDAQSTNPSMEPGQLTSSLWTLSLAVAIALIMIAGILGILDHSYSTEPGRDTHNHLAEATAYFSAGVVILTMLFMYFPSRKLDSLETRATFGILAQRNVSPLKYWSKLSGAALGLLALNAFNLIVFGRTLEVDAIALWSVYIALTWALFDLRAWRFQRSSGVALGAGRENDANFSELVSALGVASGIVALVATVFVTILKP